MKPGPSGQRLFATFPSEAKRSGPTDLPSCGNNVVPAQPQLPKNSPVELVALAAPPQREFRHTLRTCGCGTEFFKTSASAQPVDFQRPFRGLRAFQKDAFHRSLTCYTPRHVPVH